MCQVVPQDFMSVRGAGRRQRSLCMPQNGQQSTKKPYTTPTLITYGDLKITEATRTGVRTFMDSAHTFRTS